VAPKFREYYDFDRKVRDKDISDDQIGAKLEKLLKYWHYKYDPFVYRMVNGQQTKWTDQEFVDFGITGISGEIVDSAVNDLYDICDEMRAWMTKDIHVRVPTSIPQKANAQQVKIGQLGALLSEFSARIKNQPNNLLLRQKFSKIEKEKCELVKKVTRELLDSRMRYMSESVPIGTQDFYDITGKMLKKDKFCGDPPEALSAEEKKAKLDKNDKTFHNPDPEFGKDLDDFKNIEPDRTFTLDEYDPNTNDDLFDIIKKAKMNKQDYFYKSNARGFAKPLFVILKIIKASGHFPKMMRKSKLTFLPSRSIFSLDPLTKIVEVVLAKAFNKCLREHYLKNGDPCQMAYEPNRGTTSCNCVTFSLCDITLFKTGKPVAQTFADLVKAFNMANRSVMLQQIQRIAGAGDICRSRFDGRVYMYEGEERGQLYNRGVDPGAPISVLLFKTFMNTDLDLTALNVNILWAAGYSDDRAAIASADQVVGGHFQDAHSSSFEWATKHGCEYHLEIDSNTGKLDKKRPMVLEYKMKNMSHVEQLDSLTLGNTRFEHVPNMRELGLNVSTELKSREAKLVVQRRGYYFEPELSRLPGIAYRFQAIKNDYPPNFLRQMVMCWFNGVVRYGSCLYWCRALPSELDKLRFYYVMAAASILKLNAIDVVRGACCKSTAVGEDNTHYLRLLQLAGLPTLREMAMRDAVATTKQVALICKVNPNMPAFFVDQSSVRTVRSRARVDKLGVVSRIGKSRNLSKPVIEAGLPVELARIVVQSDALIGQVCRLAWECVESKKECVVSELREFEKWFSLTRKLSCNGDKVIDYRNATTCFKAISRSEFGALEAQERRINFMTPSNKLQPNKDCLVAPPMFSLDLEVADLIRGKKRKRSQFFSCMRPPPVVTQNLPDLFCNWANKKCCICGYFVICEGKMSSVNCQACGRICHFSCVQGLHIIPNRFKCGYITRHLGREAVELYETEKVVAGPPLLRYQMCLVCGSDLRADARLISCHNECKFGVHWECFSVYNAFVGVVNETRAFSDVELDPDLFICNDVRYQFRPPELEKCILREHVFCARPRPGVGDLKFDRGELLALKGRKASRLVKVKDYRAGMRRYTNEDHFCEECGRWVSLYEHDHYLSYCTGLGGTPVRRKSVYIASKCKRFRHMSKFVD
jgi:hypothetical protein